MRKINKMILRRNKDYQLDTDINLTLPDINFASNLSKTTRN